MQLLRTDLSTLAQRSTFGAAKLPEGCQRGPFVFYYKLSNVDDFGASAMSHGCSSILFQLFEFSDSCTAVDDATCLQKEGNKEEMSNKQL